MPIYWTIKSIPELSQLPPKERGIVWRRVYKMTFRHWQTWIALLGCGAFAFSGIYLAKFIDMHSTIGAAIGGGVGGLLFSQVAIYVARRYYKDFFVVQV